MADIAAIFHWDLPRLEALELSELLAWRRRAVGHVEAPERSARRCRCRWHRCSGGCR